MSACLLRVARLACAVLVVAAVGCGSGSTPEKTFAKFQESLKAKNYKEAFEQFTPDAQAELLGGIIRGFKPMSMMPIPQFQPLLKTFSAHGIELTSVGLGGEKQAAEAVADKAACLGEVFQSMETALANTPFEGKVQEAFSQLGDNALSNVSYEGDRATAQIARSDAGASATNRIEFQKIDKVWRISGPPNRGLSGSPALAGRPSPPAFAMPPGQSPSAGAMTPPGGATESIPPGASLSATGLPEETAMAGAAVPPGAAPAVAAGTPAVNPSLAAVPPGAAPGADTTNLPPPSGAMPADPAMAGAAVPPGTATPPGTGAVPPGANPATGALGMPPGDPAAAGAMAAAPGAAPGAEGGLPGDPAMAGPEGAAGGSGAQQLPPGTVEYVVQKIALALLEGKTDGVAEVISDKAKGVLGMLRDGMLTQEQLDELKEQLQEVSLLSSRPKGTLKVVVLRGKGGHVFTFTVAKEGEEFRARELKVQKPQR